MINSAFSLKSVTVTRKLEVAVIRSYLSDKTNFQQYWVSDIDELLNEIEFYDNTAGMAVSNATLLEIDN